MSSHEDYNEFSALDFACAAGMLAMVPAVLYYVSHGHEYLGTLMLAAVAAGVALVVYVLAYFLGHRLVGRLLQLVGTVLCVLFWIYAIHMWSTSDRLSTGTAEQETSQAS